MISLSDPRLPHDRTLLDAVGGFAWWYVDLVDAAGDGLVLIWSFGLPFLPGVSRTKAGARPSLNVCVYRGGRSVLWLLQEYAPTEVFWERGTDRCTFGRSRFESRVDGTLCRVDARLDCPLPGTSDRLTGTFTAKGARVSHDAPNPGEHQWTPLLAAATGEADLRVGGTTFALAGRVYHDRNGSQTPLPSLGIDHWIWGRASLGSSERVWYLLWPEDGGAVRAIGMEIGSDGAVGGPLDLEVTRGPARRGGWGMPWWEHLVLRRRDVPEQPWLEVRHAPPVEDGPFYLRFPVRASGGGRDGLGWGEAVRPDRVDVPWMRPFVGMRVHRPAGPNSLLVPLFVGLREGRVGRLLGAAR